MAIFNCYVSSPEGSICRNNRSDKGFFYSFESSRWVLTTRQRTQPPQLQESTIRQSFKKINHDTQIQILSYQYRVGYEVRPSLGRNSQEWWRMKVLTHRTRAIIWYNFGGAKIRFRFHEAFISQPGLMLNIQVQQLQGVALRSKTLCFVVCFVGQNEFPPIGKKVVCENWNEGSDSPMFFSILRFIYIWQEDSSYLFLPFLLDRRSSRRSLTKSWENAIVHLK